MPETLARPQQTLPALTRSLNAWAEVDLEAFAANLAALRGRFGPGVEVIAVVKANAYGAGVSGVAPALEAAGVERFAVVWPAEGLVLRELGIRRPILVLGHAFPEDAATAVAASLTLTVHSLAVGEGLSAAAVAQGRTVTVHLKADTGLHRFGVTPDEAVALAEALRKLPGIDVEGLTTHMANGDEADDSFSSEQHARFAEVARRLPWVRYRHTANSASALRRAGLRYSGVRIGLALHGVVPENTPDPGVRPALSLKARIARVAEVAAGEGVSYGLTWRAGRSSRVALVPVGYGDGWPRALSNRGEVLVGGQRCPIAGRVCMDQFLVDVTDVAGEVAEGDEVVLIGEQGAERVGAADVARAAGTIPWDVLASLQPRIPRIFVRGELVCGLEATPPIVASNPRGS